MGTPSRVITATLRMSSRLVNSPWLRTRYVASPCDHLAERHVLVLLTQHLDDPIDREVEGGDFLLRQLDVNLSAEPAVHRHRRHAWRALEAGRELVLRDFTQRDRIEIALDRQIDNRLWRSRRP